jgi:hypothetical protein
MFVYTLQVTKCDCRRRAKGDFIMNKAAFGRPDSSSRPNF